MWPAPSGLLWTGCWRYDARRPAPRRVLSGVLGPWVMRRIPHPYRNGELVIVIDCSDLDRSARFWADTLGYDAGAATDGHYRRLTPESGEGIEVLLQQVDDEKRGKNRLHLDLRTADLAAEVNRILGLGAMLLTSRPVVEDGWRWHVLADPDGNEFCVLQPPGPSPAGT
jgi:catechol 2,3-dioxygenase-like lactoylglutathione lyase family enzyme